MKINVEVTEVYSKMITIECKDEDEALQLVEKQYDDGDIELEASGCIDYSIDEIIEK